MTTGNGNSSSNGNGKNGKAAKIGTTSVSAEAIREALASRRDESGRVVLSDLVETAILVMFFVQRLGKASADDVIDKAAAIGAIIDKDLCDHALEALQARGLVSYSRGRRKGSSENIRMWKPKRIIWAAPPEVAQIIDLLPALVANEESHALVKGLNETEEDGDGESKGRRKQGYDEYALLRVDFVTLDELLGSQPGSPMLDAIVKKSAWKIEEANLRFWRAVDGKLMLPSDVIRGWLRTAMRSFHPRGFSETLAGYIAPNAVAFVPHALIQAAFPVVDPSTRDGKGLVTYECVPAGQTFSITFKIPTRGFVEPGEFVDFLAAYGPNPLRGISPARGGRFGRIAVTDFEIITTHEDAEGRTKQLIEAAKDLPEAARAFYNRRIAERTSSV